MCRVRVSILVWFGVCYIRGGVLCVLCLLCVLGAGATERRGRSLWIHPERGAAEGE